MKTQRKNKAKKVMPLEAPQAEVICNILDRMNFLLAKEVLQTTATKLVEDLEKALQKRLEKDGYSCKVTENSPEHELNSKFFKEFCLLLQVFVGLNGFGVDWDKRRAETLLRSMRSLEEYYNRQESAL